MEAVVVGLATLVVVFLLVVLLGVQIQITGLNRRLDEVISKMDKS